MKKERQNKLKPKIERVAETIEPRDFDKPAVYNFDQIKDVLALIKARQFPDSRFSDDEVCLWETLVEEFGINTKEFD